MWRVRKPGKKDLRSYLAEGTLFEVFVDDEWAGIVAAFQAAEKGVSGYCVGEIVLKREFRGKRLGLAVQRKFVEKLDETRGRVLWGTIGAANTPAIRTAKRCGRVDVGGYYWVRRG